MTTGHVGIRPIDDVLRKRAAAVIPGGMYGHQSVRNLTPDYPQFLIAGSGATVTDADGGTYIDLMCSYGPIILGHQHPAVEEAARAQALQGDCLNAPSPRAVELCELLVETIEHADWALLAKNGTDATTACLTIARAATGRSIVLAARGSYHGAAPWCTPSLAGVLPTDRAAMRYFDYNDSASLETAVDEAGDQLAAVIITPFKHIEGLDQELVRPEFAARIREICDTTGAALVLDDVRCGFRLAQGGSWEPLGIKPDLSAWSKALANGYPIAAVVGSDSWRDAAAEIFVTGSFWYNAVPMAASIATIDVLAKEDAVARIAAAGEELRAGIESQASSYGLGIRYTGHPSIPYLTFDADRADGSYARMDRFASAALAAGVYLAPRHNWFLNLAHTEGLIPTVLEATDRAFADVATAFGGG